MINNDLIHSNMIWFRYDDMIRFDSNSDLIIWNYLLLFDSQFPIDNIIIVVVVGVVVVVVVAAVRILIRSDHDQAMESWQKPLLALCLHCMNWI